MSWGMVLPLCSKKSRKTSVFLCYVPTNTILHKLLKRVQTYVANKQVKLNSVKYALDVVRALTKLPPTRYATARKLCGLYRRRNLETIQIDLETSPELQVYSVSNLMRI